MIYGVGIPASAANFAVMVCASFLWFLLTVNDSALAMRQMRPPNLCESVHSHSTRKLETADWNLLLYTHFGRY